MRVSAALFVVVSFVLAVFAVPGLAQVQADEDDAPEAAPAAPPSDELFCAQFCCVIGGRVVCPEAPEDPPGHPLAAVPDPNDPYAVENLLELYRERSTILLQELEGEL